MNAAPFWKVMTLFSDLPGTSITCFQTTSTAESTQGKALWKFFCIIERECT